MTKEKGRWRRENARLKQIVFSFEYLGESSSSSSSDEESSFDESSS
jgi:hypothetical protein